MSQGPRKRSAENCGAYGALVEVSIPGVLRPPVLEGGSGSFLGMEDSLCQPTPTTTTPLPPPSPAATHTQKPRLGSGATRFISHTPRMKWQWRPPALSRTRWTS